MYTDIKNILQQSLHHGVKLGLQNMERLLAHFGNPHLSFRVVHVAGTNGKGSVTLKMAKALESAGARCGLYTSPHISSFRERIKINGVMIAEEEVGRYLVEIAGVCEREGFLVTFFELLTIVAFCYFRDQKVDCAVVEVGMGGRLDATNVVQPMISVITSIGLDHQEFLGDTVEAICREKAGIIKRRVPVVIGPTVPYHVIIEEKNVGFVSQIRGSFVDYEQENRVIAREALAMLMGLREGVLGKIKIKEKDIVFGLAHTPPCRFGGHRWGGREVILDVGHNPQGIARVIERIKERPCHVLVPFSKGKDYRDCLTLMAKAGMVIHTCPFSHHRLMRPEEIVLEGVDVVMHASIGSFFESVSSGLVLVCGSFFIMSDVRAFLGIDEARDPDFWAEAFVDAKQRDAIIR